MKIFFNMKFFIVLLAFVILLNFSCVALLCYINSIHHMKIEHWILGIEHFIICFNVEPLRGSIIFYILFPRVKTRG